MDRFDFPRRKDPTQPYAPPAADGHDQNRDVFGDSGPWTWLLAEAWQQAASPATYAGPRRAPAVPHDADGHFDLVAYWAPLVSLMHHGLGWRRPDLGLWRWRHEAQDFDDPVLTTLNRRYGHDLDLLMAWLTSPGSYVNHNATAGQQAPKPIVPLEMKRYCAMVQEAAAYRDQFTGGGDPHHLGIHLQRDDDPGPVSHVPARGAKFMDQCVDQILVAERFHDGFAALRSGLVPSGTDGRSTRVALIWPSGGWLGTYRCSRKTGMWFRGRHAVHELGNE